MAYYDDVKEAADHIRARISTVPDLAIVLGSGLGDFAGTLGDAVSLPYTDLLHWPASKVIGHEGRLVVGTVGGRTIGALMVIDDHINLLGTNPLAGPNDERFGVRFPDMTEVYSRRLRAVADAGGKAVGVDLPHGVYVSLLGPSYETPAEIRFLRTIGADAVGMSTVPEAIVARHMGMEVLGISCITNMAAGVLPQPLDHQEVMETARRVRGQFIGLLNEVVARV